MPPWPVVLTLIDIIEITAHDDPEQFRPLCAKYHAMMVRRPVEGNEDEAE